MTCALFPLLSKTSLWTNIIKNNTIDASTTTATKASTSTVKTIQASSTVHPRPHGAKNDTDSVKSMKSIEHHSSNIYESDRDIVRKHSKHSE